MDEKRYRAKVLALPDIWNTKCWIIGFLEKSDHKGNLYFSTSAQSPPLDDTEIGAEGVVYKHYLNGLKSNYIWHWEADYVDEEEKEEE